MSTPRRRYPLRALTTAAVALAALVLPMATATATTATAAVASPAAEPASVLRLMMIPDRPATGRPVVTVTLECDPAGGTHPAAADACATLAEADGSFADIEPRRKGCNKNWDPVTIAATGHWQGRDISFAAEHPNPDCAAAATGEIFAFLPMASLSLTITPDEPTDRNPVTTVTLTCGPDGGTHPDPKHACAVLAEVGGSFADIPPSRDSCLAVWIPVTVTATGYWRNHEIDFEARHSNRGCAAVASNYLFGF